MELSAGAFKLLSPCVDKLGDTASGPLVPAPSARLFLQTAGVNLFLVAPSCKRRATSDTGVKEGAVMIDHDPGGKARR